MSWKTLHKDIQFLEAEIVNDVFQDIEYVKNKFTDAGYIVDTLVQVNANYRVQIAEVINILQGIEDDLTKINDALLSPYYKSHKTVESNFKIADYNRWVGILNDLKVIADGEKGQWAYLILSDNKQAVDTDGNPFIIRGDTI